MSWQILKNHASLIVDANGNPKFDNAVERHYCWSNAEVGLANNFFDCALLKNEILFSSSQIVQMFFMSPKTFDAPDGLYYVVFFSWDSFLEYYNQGIAEGIDFHASTQSKANGKSVITSVVGNVVTDATNLVGNVVDNVTKNILGFQLSKVLPYVLAGVIVFAGFVAYKRYAK